jgi:hypothetical protein
MGIDYKSKADVVAVQSWNGLPRKVRREVRRHARKGSLHPSPSVAETSIKWAELLLRKRPQKNTVDFIGVILGLAIDWITRGSGSSVLGGAIGTRMYDRKVARRIIRARDEIRNRSSKDE